MDVLQFHFYFPQKCAMRSSSIESNNTTIYNRPILCNSQERLGESFIFSLLCEMVFCQYRVIGNLDTEMHFAHLGRKKKKKKNKEDKKTNKSDNVAVCELESQRATNLSGIKVNRRTNDWIRSR